MIKNHTKETVLENGAAFDKNQHVFDIIDNKQGHYSQEQIEELRKIRKPILLKKKV